MTVKQVLSGHYSTETSYVIQDYPFGFKLRCKRRCWLEVNDKGTRFWSQTTDPRKSIEVWNKPKASTYIFMGAMFLDENDHVQWNGLSVHNAEKAGDFLTTYGEGLTDAQKNLCKRLADAYARRTARATLSVNESPVLVLPKCDTPDGGCINSGACQIADKCIHPKV